MKAGGFDHVDGHVVGEQVVGIDVPVMCDGSRDHAHLEVGPLASFDLLFDEGAQVAMRDTAWTRFVEYDGVHAYEIDCYICHQSQVIAEPTMLRFIEIARTVYEHGGPDTMPIRLRDIGRP